VAERITRGWRDQSPATTLSVGVAVHDDERPVSATFSQADTALYRAKRNGRDQVRIFGRDASGGSAGAPIAPMASADAPPMTIVAAPPFPDMPMASLPLGAVDFPRNLFS
jgi:hypothetical protein